jgi:putative colanic acid biosynthesis UDP-glucose lipid carrier transferase
MFRQKRTGRGGRVFTCYKFRSMDVTERNGVRQERHYPFGDFMRTTGIDELPQFWNVLKGDMAVVGPRPHMLSHDEKFGMEIPSYNERFRVRPGITGWAQVNGFRGTTELNQVRQRVEHDIWYIEHQSLALDIKIAIMTVKVMIKGWKNDAL